MGKKYEIVLPEGKALSELERYMNETGMFQVTLGIPGQKDLTLNFCTHWALDKRIIDCFEAGGEEILITTIFLKEMTLKKIEEISAQIADRIKERAFEDALP